MYYAKKDSFMKGLEKIYHNKKLVASIFRASINIEGVKFFTDPQNPFQVGFHNRKKGINLDPHIHKIEKPLRIDHIQELLYVQKGKIKVSFYTRQGKLIKKSILSRDEAVLILDVGHGVEIISDAKIFQVKQGPFPGTEHAKIYLKK